MNLILFPATIAMVCRPDVESSATKIFQAVKVSGGGDALNITCCKKKFLRVKNYQTKND